MDADLAAILQLIQRLEHDAQKALARHEASGSRAMSLEDSYSQLGRLSLGQDELFREALRAIENSLYRASHVLAWAGFIDFLHNYLFEDGGTAITAEYPKWNLTGPEDLREVSEFQVIEAGRAAKFYNKTTMKALHGLLNKRNECAHPSDFLPDLNETLGYLSELFKRVAYLQSKQPS
jgi:hypothetical protein